MSERSLPDLPLEGNGEVGSAFVALSIGDYRSAACYVRDLAYGRSADRSDYRLVLPKRRGTCSAKHALLTAPAREHDTPVELKLGIYLMDGRNTPGVGPVPARHDMQDLPEAHCYLVHRGRRVDLTQAGARVPDSFLAEETIEPGESGSHKTRVHRGFVRSWATENGFDADEAWVAREGCIAALSSR